MDIRFGGKIALVTGAGKGIGRGIVKALFDCGACVHAISRTQSDLDTLESDIPIDTYCLDLTDWEETRQLVEKIGHVDMLVNCAGIFHDEPFLETSKDALEKVFNTNTFSAYNVSQAVANKMVEDNSGGVIVNISSDAALKVYEGYTAYCMSKAAVDMMTKCMALELGKHQIRVVSVNPSWISTSMTEKRLADPKFRYDLEAKIPSGHAGKVADVTNTVLFLLSDKADMITGSNVLVDGGYVIG